MTKTPPTVGRLIRYHRRRLGLTQEALAIEVGVSTNAVARWELGYTRKIRKCYIEAICRVFWITPDELRGDGKEI